MKWPFYLNLFLILFLSLANMGVIRKEQDPIMDTQTEGIAYKQKMEEIKDGEKGPPTPSFAFYKKEKFLAEPPFEKDIPTSAQKISDSAQEGILEDDNFFIEDGSSSATQQDAATEEWWQDEPVDTGKAEEIAGNPEHKEPLPSEDTDSEETTASAEPAGEDSWWDEGK